MKQTFQTYLAGFSGKQLLAKNAVLDYGVWEITGEQTDRETPPHLGYVEGVLEDVIDYAIALPNFWSWGSGGSIKRLDIKKVDAQTNQIERELKERREALEAELKEINQRLG